TRLLAALKPGEQVVVMGPTGAPTEIPEGETVLLAGGGLGNAVLFSIAKALKARGDHVVYFAGYKNGVDLFKQDEIEVATDQVVWTTDTGAEIAPRRPQDRHFRGNIVQAMVAYAEGRLGGERYKLRDVKRIIAIGSDRMMNAVREARHGVLAPHLDPKHVGIASINSPMQCMMKEVCAQCLQKHVDPATGKETIIFTCFNQDQEIDKVDFKNLNSRLRANTAQEKISNAWLERLLTKAPEHRRILAGGTSPPCPLSLRERGRTLSYSPPVDGAVAAAFAGPGVGVPSASTDAGSTTEKVLPLPSYERTSMRPPAPCTILWLIARPRPVPLSLVVKKGMNRFSSTFCDRPGPLSATVTSTNGSSEPLVPGRVPRPKRTRLETMIRPRPFMAWDALRSRFISTWRSCSASIITRGNVGARLTSTWISSLPGSAETIWSVRRTTAFTSMGRAVLP